MKYYLLKHTISCNGYEFSGHAIIRAKNTPDAVAKRGKYYYSYFADGDCRRQGGFDPDYSYYDGDVIFKDCQMELLTEMQAKTIQSLIN